MTVAKDILVDTKNPDSLDTILNWFGAALVGGGMPGGYVKRDGHYVARCFRDAGFIKFMIEQQGYGKVVGELDELACTAQMHAPE